MIKSLILDLDDTIFPTRSIGMECLAPLFQGIPFRSYGYQETEIANIMEELWKRPMADVAELYGFPDQLINEYQRIAATHKFAFEITPYEDYINLKSLPHSMHLVTTGTTPVQQQKIDALGIRGDFRHILINDPFVVSGGKQACFIQILEKESLQPEQVLVIGDNEDSEIAAAKKLDIPWILVDRSLNKHDLFNRRISGFDGLKPVLDMFGPDTLDP